MRSEMKAFRKWFVIVVGSCMAVGLSIAVVRLATGKDRFFYSAKFTEFYVCTGADPATGLPLAPVAEVPSATEKLYACGYLKADGSAPLHFLLFYEGKSTRWFDHEESYRAGYVLKEIPRFWQEPGTYRVEARLNRHMVASTTFTVVP
jgi:hypothetical protein